MRNFKKMIATSLIITTMIGTGTTIANATRANPAPSPLRDVWEYGTNGNYGWSNYIMLTDGYGSESAVRNIYGSVKDHARANYGWANSSATKAWYDIRLYPFWNFYRL